MFRTAINRAVNARAEGDENGAKEAFDVALRVILSAAVLWKPATSEAGKRIEAGLKANARGENIRAQELYQQAGKYSL